MRFLRRIAGILGFLKEEAHEANEEAEETVDHHNNRGNKEETRRPSKGFRVQVPVPGDRTHIGPIITPSNLGDGGVQGLRWYARRLRIDEDGDVADEFLDEVLQDVSKLPPDADVQRQPRKFEVKYSTRPAKVRKQMIAVDGKVHQGVEYQGRLQWV